MDKKKKSDRFCWTCHYDFPEDGQGPRVQYRCRTCPRVFHPACLNKLSACGYLPAKEELTGSRQMTPEKPSRVNPNREVKARKPEVQVICQECLASTETCIEQLKGLRAEVLKKLLKNCLKQWKTWIAKDLKGPDSTILDVSNYGDELDEYKGSVCKVMDLKILERMVDAGEIHTLEAFAAELKWIKHASITFNGRVDTATEEISDVEEMFFRKLNQIALSCLDCQLWICDNWDKKVKDGATFMKPCKIPHPVMLVQIRGFPNWPVKIIHYKGNNLMGLCFGDHCSAGIISKFLPFSEENANRDTKKSPKRRVAVEEARRYLKSVAETPEIGPQVAPVPNVSFTFEGMQQLFPRMSKTVLEAAFRNSIEPFKPLPYLSPELYTMVPDAPDDYHMPRGRGRPKKK